MTGEVRIDGLRLRGCHGVLALEARRPQPFIVDILLRLDLRDAARRDDLGATVDYAVVARLAADVVHGPRRRLIESLAGAIAEAILAGFPCVESGWVVVHKPEAPVGLPCGDISVQYPFARAGSVGTGPAEVGGLAGVPLPGK